MKRILTLIALALVCTAMSANVSDALKVKTYTLDNGLTVWINEDSNQNSVYGAVVVKAGAADCPGTGIAHYFEHMMFKGTDKIGTVDYAAEKPYLDSIAVMYDKLSETVDPEAKKEIQMEINRLSIKAADYAIPNEYDVLIAEMGGSNLNAFTSFDETVYHNEFIPEYFEQWAELNSERVINPVFRLFQSELETVYEEKNRSDDNMVSDFQNKLLATMYGGSGYELPVLGTTENLKNPRLSQMAKFFNDYYVAGNMGLVLTGNITAEEALPVIERTFGRIRPGTAPARPESNLTPIKGRKDVDASIDIPLVKLGALSYRGPATTDPDYLGMEFMTQLLNNEAGTGILDKMAVNHELMMAQASNSFSFKESGAFMVIYMPKLVGQKEEKATALVMGALDKLRTGDFSDEFFESCKMSYKKEQTKNFENLSNRMLEMVFAFAEGKDWNNLLTNPEKIDAFTKEDIMALAQKYFGNDYVLFHKSKTPAPKDNLKKPDYKKVVPPNKDASSAYAEALRQTAVGIGVEPKAVDFSKDLAIKEVTPLVKLYASSNPYNDVFELTLAFQKGNNEKQDYERVSSYVNLLGTTDKSYEEIRAELQAMGSNVYFNAGDNEFTVNVSGFDANLDKTLEVVADLLYNIKGDKKKLGVIKSDEKSEISMSHSDMSTLSKALREYVCYGQNSEFINKKGDFTDAVLLGLFHDVQKVECDVLYSGSLDAAAVADALSRHIKLDEITVASAGPIDFAPEAFDKPTIYFVDKKDASQSQIWCLVQVPPTPDQAARYQTILYNNYLGGGGMSNLMFQEIREFRSMAYSTGSGILRGRYKNALDKNGILMAFVGTQSDKTIDAMEIVDSLITKTPFLEERIGKMKIEALNDKCVNQPDFRELPSDVQYDIRSGYTSDPNAIFAGVVEGINAKTLEAIWKDNISGRPTVWAIVGNSKKVDMDALTAFGTVKMVKATEIIK